MGLCRHSKMFLPGKLPQCPVYQLEIPAPIGSHVFVLASLDCNSNIYASPIAGRLGIHHHAKLLFEMGSH
jgi:hypothetical protein